MIISSSNANSIPFDIIDIAAYRSNNGLFTFRTPFADNDHLRSPRLASKYHLASCNARVRVPLLSGDQIFCPEILIFDLPPPAFLPLPCRVRTVKISLHPPRRTGRRARFRSVSRYNLISIWSRLYVGHAIDLFTGELIDIDGIFHARGRCFLAENNFKFRYLPTSNSQYLGKGRKQKHASSQVRTMLWH